MIRAEKTTPNANAYRTLLPGAVLALAILVGIDPLARLYDQHLRARPWIAAEVEIVPVVGALPTVRYAVPARSYVSGRWMAWIETESGLRLCGGTGTGSYGPETTEARLWSWEAWLGRACPEPAAPYRLCVTYAVETPRGAQGRFGPYCSAIHRPG